MKGIVAILVIVAFMGGLMWNTVAISIWSVLFLGVVACVSAYLYKKMASTIPRGHRIILKICLTIIVYTVVVYACRYANIFTITIVPDFLR